MRTRNYRPTLEVLESRLAPSADVLTYHNDNASTGQDLSETVLTPANVNAASFGMVFTAGLDGQVFAQPLYMANVTITTGSHQGVHNVVFAATEFDSVYAIDATAGTVLWHDNFTNPSAGVTPVPSNDVKNQDIAPWIGITGTPVIDPATDTIYVLARTKEVTGGNNHYVDRLHALDLSNGGEKFGGPLVVADTISNDLTTYTFVSGPSVNGTGMGSVGGKITFNALIQNQRPALTLANGTVYVGYASHGDKGPYHGWVLGFNTAGAGQTLQLVAAFNATPNGLKGGIWMSGGKIAADDAGNLYLTTGNGTLDAGLNAQGFPSKGDYGEAFLKLVVDPNSNPTHQNQNGWGLKVADYFRPFNAKTYNMGDMDLGSGAPLLLPDSAGSATHPHLMIAGGKLATVYLVDRDNMGKFDPSRDHVVQEWAPTNVADRITFGYFSGQLYYDGLNKPAVGAETFTIANGKITTTPTSQSADTYPFPSSTPSISANGSANGIVWNVDLNTDQVRAYDASSYADELYTTAQAANGRDVPGPFPKFILPTVADGRVYLGTNNSLVGYGLLGAQSHPAPALALVTGISGVPPARVGTPPGSPEEPSPAILAPRPQEPAARPSPATEPAALSAHAPALASDLDAVWLDFGGALGEAVAAQTDPAGRDTGDGAGPAAADAAATSPSAPPAGPYSAAPSAPPARAEAAAPARAGG
jgi:hypothetical protein